ncbi:MAG: glycosyltransferase involved in cell wall biosynthesis, partial [Candidatus Omnitrophota bacterium]
MKICILIPTYNEVKAIGSLIDEIKEYELDIIVSDDGSTDGTATVASEKDILVLEHAQRTGKGATLRRGFDKVSELEYDGVIIMDGDGQHAPKDLPKFLKNIKEDPKCMIVGNRLSDSKGMPFVRLITNRIMSWVISCACGQRIADTQSGFR